MVTYLSPGVFEPEPCNAMSKHYLMTIGFYFLTLLYVPAFAEKYVKMISSGTADGSSWGNASDDLQAMINAAATGEAIYVAKGKYKPKSYPASCNGCSTPRDHTFSMRDIKLYGGFPDFGDPSFSDRNVSAYETILSGDKNDDDIILGGGDNVNFGNFSDNVYHVLLSVNDNDAMIDGFTIVGGRADTPTYHTIEGVYTLRGTSGGGLLALSSKISVSNCKFLHNGAEYGAGVGNRNGTMDISGSIFRQNRAKNEAGGILSDGLGSLNVTLCLIEQNTADTDAAIHTYRSPANITRCTVRNNHAGYSGIISCGVAPVNIINTAIYKNRVSGRHILEFLLTDPKIVNCTIYGNNQGAQYEIAVIYGSDSNIELRNTIVNGNSATNGSYWSLMQYGGSFWIYNSIVESPSAQYFGSGNLVAANPVFVNSDDPDGPDDIPGTADDGLRLQKTSPGIDNGNPTNAPSDDILGNPVYNLTRDMGAYENLQGKDIYAGSPACQTITLSNVAGNKWFYFNHAGGLVAAINPNGMDLGTMTLEISDEPGAISYNSATFLGRTMNVRSGRYGTAVLPGSYTIRFYYPDAELAQYNAATSGGFTPGDFILAFKEGGSGCSLNTYVGTKSGMVQKSKISNGEYGQDNYGFYLQTSLNHFTIFAASTDENYPFPVDLISFKGTAMQTHNLLEWQTASETNNAYYEMQRSADGRSFGAIGERVSGAGDSKSTRIYSFRDKLPIAGINYYRLKQVDFDGTFTLSHIVAVQSKRAGITLYPNPVSKELFVKTNGKFQYRIVNVAGTSAMHGTGTGMEPLSIEHLPSGTYFLLIDGAAHQFVKR